MALDSLFSSLGTYAAVVTLAAVLLGLAVKLGARRLQCVMMRPQSTPTHCQRC